MNINEILSTTEAKNNLSELQCLALRKILEKLTRIIIDNPNEIDYWEDIASYATLGGQLNVTEKENETI